MGKSKNYPSKRVLILSCDFIDYSIHLANALSEREIEVQLIMPDFDREEYSFQINPKVDVYIYSQSRFYHPYNLYILYKKIIKLSAFNPDIIHIQGGDLWFSLLIPFLFRFIYIVTTMHDVQPHLGENHFWTRFILNIGRTYSHKIIVHGKKSKELLISKFGVDEKKICVITIGEHNVEPFLKFKKNELKEERNIILFFGRIREYKGLNYLIEAEPLILSEIPAAKIIIAGSGKDFLEYQKQIKHKNNFLIYNHYISYQEAARLFQRSSVVVLPYIEASQSGVISTAYGFMKPVVATDVGDIPDIVDDGITGLIVPSRDPISLAKAIIRLLKDDEMRNQMGINAYKKLKTDMSWVGIGKETIQIYDELCKHK